MVRAVLAQQKDPASSKQSDGGRRLSAGPGATTTAVFAQAARLCPESPFPPSP